MVRQRPRQRRLDCLYSTKRRDFCHGVSRLCAFNPSTGDDWIRLYYTLRECFVREMCTMQLHVCLHAPVDPDRQADRAVQHSSNELQLKLLRHLGYMP